jgi:hypothetical protein
MEDSVVVRLPSKPTANQLLGRVRGMVSEAALAQKPSRLRFDHPHVQQRLRERKLNMRQIMETLRKGKATNPPELDQYGDWRIKLRRRVAGRRVQVVVAVKTDHVVLVTVI